MKVKFFENKGNIVLDSVFAGVYCFKIGKVGVAEDSYKPLYVGESYSMLKRCSEHIYNVFNVDPQYFGLTVENLKNDDLQLIVEIYESVVLPEKILNSDRDILLREKEMVAIEKLKPLSQNETNDNLCKNRVEIVQAVIKELLE